MTCCTLIACKHNEVTFTYSPTSPRAGQPVVFSNQSTSGEEWEWTFGDGATSSIKSPTHTFKQPGTYTVTLRVDKKNSWREVQNIEVLDTVPSIAASDSLFSIYRDYTFTAQLYNPYNYEVEYLWNHTEGETIRYIDTVFTQSTLRLYFTQATPSIEIGLRIVLNGDTTTVSKQLTVSDRATHSLLLRTADGDYRQRIFEQRAEDIKADATAATLLDAEQDTAQAYNGHEFTLTELAATFTGMKGFHIANRKLYYRADGLWVANIDGSNRVQIDERDCSAMTLNLIDNRIYWANNEGVWFMPFIGSDNNRFVTTPTRQNDLTNVTILAIDEEKK